MLTFGPAHSRQNAEQQENCYVTETSIKLLILRYKKNRSCFNNLLTFGLLLGIAAPLETEGAQQGSAWSIVRPKAKQSLLSCDSLVSWAKR